MAARRLLGQVLKDLKLVHEGMVQEALALQREKGGQIGGLLVQLGHLAPRDLARGLAQQAGLPFEELSGTIIPSEVLRKVDASTARVFRVLPLRLEGDALVVALSDPLNASVLSDLAFTTGGEVRGAVAEERELLDAIERCYAAEELRGGKERVAELVAELKGSSAKFDMEDAASMAAAPPVVKLLNYILYQAIRDKASDIHLEPFEQDFKIRYRVDGALYELEAPPPHLAVALVSRVKVMADLDIAETRFPQDGRIELTVGGRSVDLRVSTLPTMFGESTVLRILDRSVVSLDLESLGLRSAEMETISRLLALPHGIVLVTGPTGSGKTTSLYAALNAKNDVGIKIITVEDPVEYDLEGIIQVPVNEEIGVTYARVLRTILRQDPDVILVGEIRDRDTAQTAIEASLTGHLVFSTLHTNDAPSAVTRLVDIGVEPFLLAATLEAVVAQRLVRRICAACRQQYAPDENVLRELGVIREEVGDSPFAFGKGCEECNFTGYRGRMGLFEIMVMDARLREMVLESASSSMLRAGAVEQGMRTLREAGMLAILDGLTTVEEVVRETMVS